MWSAGDPRGPWCSQLLGTGRDREAVALDRVTGEAEFHVLQLGVEDTHLPGDIEVSGWHLIKPALDPIDL